MATVASICTAINTQLLTLDDVDYVSTDDFSPVIKSAKVTALTLPFGFESTTKPIAQTAWLFIHRIRTEFWVKHVQGSEATTMNYARDIGRNAVNALIDADGTGYTLYRNSEFEFQVDRAPVTDDGGLPWVVCVLVTPVMDNGCD